ncbi:MAG: hypothetical protein ABH849_00620 [Nanoarchaeota archaeon]
MASCHSKRKYHHKRKINIGICYSHLHLGRKRTKVYKCKYCGEFFCKEHLKAKPPGMPRFKGTSHEDRLFMEEWHKPGGHPCVPYLEHWKAKNEREKQEYGLALDRLIRSKPPQFKKEEKWHEPIFNVPLTKKKQKNFKSKPIQSKKKRRGYKHTYKKPLVKKKQKNYIKYIIFGLILLAVFLFISFMNKDCSDGTQSQNCSINKPFFCQRFGSLVENPSVCGCPENEREYQNNCIQIIECEDGTLHPECSTNKPYQCVNGSLVKRASVCGCPDEYMRKGKSNSCEPIQRCSDGTIHNQCSDDKPYLCVNGSLAIRAAICGCPEGSVQRGPNSNSCEAGSKSDPSIYEIDSLYTVSNINDNWVHGFMLIVNNKRVELGYMQMQESEQLNEIAKIRFNTMMEEPFISHYGAGAYNVGEVIFYPEGFTEQGYVNDIQVNAPIHWDGLIDPMFSSYGYHLEEGPVMQIWGYCPVTEIVGANVDTKEFFDQHGCETSVGNSMWLVINMI